MTSSGDWRDALRGAENLVREGAEAFAGMRELIEEGGPLPCVVGLHSSLEECGRAATMEVYGLSYCEIHGAECKAGALAEIYHDAAQEVGRPLNGHVAPMTPEAERVLQAASDELTALVRDAEEDEELLVRAFPLVRERVCAGTLEYVEAPDAWGRYSPPYDTHRSVRVLIHRLMRVAYEEGEGWLVETLEPRREETAAQAAYALALEEEAGFRPALS